jgi:hypothetical protein
MIDLFKSTLIGQYEAALLMFKDAASRCPDDKWEGNVGDFPFWHVAYHTLFFTDLYLSLSPESFEPPEFYRENYQFFGRLPPSNEPLVADIPYGRETILAYVEHCRRKALRSIEEETSESLRGPCGFWWYKIPRSEFHLDNIRHVQHHAAQMSLYLKRVSGIDIDWVGGRST